MTRNIVELRKKLVHQIEIDLSQSERINAPRSNPHKLGDTRAIGER
jgi:hypothetical protein